MPIKHIKLEVCCPDLQSVKAAVEAGARRIELCQDLACGGLTPSVETISAALDLCGGRTSVHVLFRPRPGDFVYNEDELQLVCSQIASCPPVSGMVIGALTKEGEVDISSCRRMIASAPNIPNITFHRAFELCKEPLRALEDIIALGCNRLLTSGQAPSAIEGTALLKKLVHKAEGRIIIMAGAGVNSENVLRLIRETGVPEVHGSCKGSKEEIQKILGYEI